MTSLFLILLALLLAIPIYAKLVLSIHTGYVPVWSDEFFYFLNAFSAFENNTLVASLTFGGKGSLLFGADAHGFAYPLLHSIIANMVGWSNLNIIWLNIALILLAILLVIAQPNITWMNKLFFAALILVYPFAPLYMFTYMQEIIHVFFAVICSILLYKIYTTEYNIRLIYIFIATVFIAGLFRPWWPFWTIGLLPLANNYKQRILFFIYFCVFVILSFLMAKYFYESFPHFFSQNLDLLYQGKFFDFLLRIYARFQVNFLAYFANYQSIMYFSLKYSIVILTIYFAIDAIVRGNKLHATISIIGITNLMFLLIVNDANDWREIRAMSPVFYFYCLFIALSKDERFKVSILAITIFLFVNSIPVIQTRVTERNRFSDSNVVAEKQAEMFKMLGKIKQGEALIRLDFSPRDYSYELLQLPIKTELNEPIRYIVPYYPVPQEKAYYTLKRQGVIFELVKEP